MVVTLAALVALALCVVLFGAKLFALFGLVVGVAMFHFPLGTIGLVGLGVALTFLFVPRHHSGHSPWHLPWHAAERSGEPVRDVSSTARSGTGRSAGWQR